MTEQDNFDVRVIRSAITWNGVGLTLEKFLAGRFTYRSLEEWRTRIQSGEITLNGQLVAPDQPLALHDIVEYRPGDIAEPPCNPNFKIVYEDEQLLVVDKPGDLCVHPSGPYFKNTLWHLLGSQYGEIHLINRLDRETSGLLLVARDAETARKLEKQRQNIAKEYLVVVHGNNFPSTEFTARGFLIADTQSEVRKKRRFVPGERPPAGALKIESCATILAPEQQTPHYTLVRARLVTGRMHQIRATVYSLGFPVVGDKLYGVDEKIFLKLRRDAIDAADRAKLQISRQALHSTRLKFRHPGTGEDMDFTSTLPDELQNVLDSDK